MDQISLSDLAAAAQTAVEPKFVAPTRISFGGVDPLGLRQINFDLMDEVLPGLNNVARHIRPFVVVAWAWRRAVQLAKSAGAQHIKVEELREFVDRIEVLYVMSQILRDANVDLPGRQYLAPWLEEADFTFGGPKWKKRRSQRAYSTALSAPVNYGPGLKLLGWLGPHPDYPEVLLPRPEVTPALDALEASLRPALKHAAFSVLGSVTVTRKEVTRWGELWSLECVTSAEADVMGKLLMGETAPPARRLGIRLMLAASSYKRSVDTAELRVAMYKVPEKVGSHEELLETRARWRRVQVRQLFRLALESLLYWVMLNLEASPRSVEALVKAFLEALPLDGNMSAGDWIRDLASHDLSPNDLIDRITEDLRGGVPVELPYNIARALALCLTEPNTMSQHHQPVDRLPLARAQREAEARARAPVRDFIRHMIESWVFAQHSYWSVGRGLADARAGGRTLLRLRVLLDEGGWTLTPGAPITAPRPTPDRLETAISLAAESRLLQQPLG